MRIFNLGPCTEDCGITVYDPYNCDVSVSDPNPCFVELFLPGPSGPTGPVGPVGPQGPPGSSSGIYAVVSTSETIPTNQLFTICNGVGVITLTLPLISSVVTGDLTQTFNLRNISNSQVNIICSGEDQIEFQSSATLFQSPSSYTLLPTSEGWLIL